MTIRSGMPLFKKTPAFDEYTGLLLHFDGDNESTTITDSSQYNHSGSVKGNAKISTSEYKFGSSSVYIPSGGVDAVNIAHNSVFDLSSKPLFTIDCWIYCPSIASRLGICAKWNSGGKRAYTFIRESNGKFMFFCGTGGSTGSVASTDTWSLSTSTWTHVAAVYDGNNLTFYADGISHGGGALTPSIGNFTDVPFQIGTLDENDTLSRFNGYIDEFRFSNGIARWTSNFTPPTAPYTM